MVISQEKVKYSKVTPGLIKHPNEWVGNHPQVVNQPIYNDNFFVPDPEGPGKKIRVSKLILYISIYEIHNYLVSESSIYPFKKIIYKTTGKLLISDTALHALIPKNVRKMIDRYNQMCGCEICVIICYM